MRHDMWIYLFSLWPLLAALLNFHTHTLLWCTLLKIIIFSLVFFSFLFFSLPLRIRVAIPLLLFDFHSVHSDLCDTFPFLSIERRHDCANAAHDVWHTVMYIFTGTTVRVNANRKAIGCYDFILHTFDIVGHAPSCTFAVGRYCGCGCMGAQK